MGTNWLLAIAIDEYVHKPLYNCVNDVKAFIELATQRYGIEEDRIIRLFNEAATADGIYGAFDDLFDKVKPQDNLILYYSGHGDYHGRWKEGYWIPFDAESRAKYIPNDSLKRYLREIRTRHTLIICDSCFSGTFAVKSAQEDYAPEALLERYQNASRWVITSGSKQEVLDGERGGHSPFANALLTKMRSHQGNLSARALGDYIISDLATKKMYQQPLSEAFDQLEHQGGLFVFFQKQTETQLWAATQAADTADAYYTFWQKYPENAHAEDALWQCACRENTIATYNHYLSHYRRGKFYAEAKKTLHQLEDEAAWKQALRRDTINAYWDYLDRFEDDGGKYVAEAHEKIKTKSEPKTPKNYPPTIIIPEKPTLDIPQPTVKTPPREAGELEPEMIFVPGGTFKMGSNDNEREKPIHDVTVKDFYIGKYPVTFAEYDAYCEATKTEKPKDQGWGRDRRPVINVNWHDAQAYCKWLSKQTSKNYRLPSEAEWEYAARGGKQSKGFEYAGRNDLDQVGWFWENSGDKKLSGEWNTHKIIENNCKTRPVGEKKANELGIHDMSGNVWEWCEDLWHRNYKGALKDGSAWTSGGDQDSRVVRGGSWYIYVNFCRVSFRFRYRSVDRNHDIGFRLARY
jgi:formylglycine-generating enzyme required for sulfatase activity